MSDHIKYFGEGIAVLFFITLLAVVLGALGWLFINIIRPFVITHSSALQKTFVVVIAILVIAYVIGFLKEEWNGQIAEWLDREVDTDAE